MVDCGGRRKAGHGCAPPPVQERFDRRHDPGRGVTVAEGEGRSGHALVEGPVLVQRPHRLDDGVGVGTDQADIIAFDGLAALGDVAKNEDGLAERGRLLLEAAAVGEDQPAMAEAGDHFLVIERIEKGDVFAGYGEDAEDFGRTNFFGS